MNFACLKTKKAYNRERQTKMAKHGFEKICILGMGFIGGSIGMAVRKKKLARHVLGVSRKKETIRKALGKGAIDSGTTNLREGAANCDFLIIAVPVSITCGMVKKAVPYLKKDSIITDVGSTKKEIVEEIDGLVSGDIGFVGSHPLAGSEKSGIDAATDSLFTKRTCIITPGHKSSEAIINKVKMFWESLAMQVLIMKPEEHDFILALTSHLPHLAAAGLVNMAEDFRQEDSRIIKAVASGFLDTTRIAGSSPALWHDICMSNRKAIVSTLKTYRELLRKIETAIKNGESPALIKFLEKARDTRDELNKNQRQNFA